MLERLQKVISAAGVASRRDAEALIAAGKVTVNGQVVTETGAKVDPDRDNVAVRGRSIPMAVEKIYVLLNKPAGYVTTREDPHAEHIVMDLVRPPLEAKLGRGNPAVEGLHPVGRLDTQTEGLLILTNDGEFTQLLTHPRHGVPKVYQAEVRGVPEREDIEKLRAGVPLFGRRTLPARVRVRRVDRTRGLASVEVELREGRNQQVRRMLQAVGFPVTRLRRVAIGPVTLGRLRLSRWRFLTEAEVDLLRGAARGAIAEVAPPPPAPRRPVSGGRPRRPGPRSADDKTGPRGPRPRR
jgi:23S rRNA pseudouridine2605 synthase